MKHTKLVAVLAVLAFNVQSFAASTGTLLLQGTVAAVNDIVVTPNTPNNTTLDIVAGESGKNVASVAETSNNLNGYKIFISSPTGGFLVNTSDAAAKTSYKISYDGATAVTPTVAPLEVKNVTSLTGLTTDNSAVAADVTAFTTAPAGLYEDTLTVSIVAN